MTALVRDIRQALSLIRRNPGFSAAALATIALGTGGTTAVFSVVYGVLLRPLPYDEPDRIVVAAEEHPGATSAFGGTALSNLTYAAWAPRAETIEAMGAYSTRAVTLSDTEPPERLRGTAITPSLVRVLRIAPAAGRLFVEADEADGAEPVVVLAHGFWQRRFGADPAAVGGRLVLDEVPHRIVGVAPAGFEFPGPEPVAFYAVQRVPAPQPGSGSVGTLRVLARLRPGATPAQAAAEATAAARSVERPLAATLLFGEGGPVEVRVAPLAERLTDDVRPALVVFSAGMLLVLLVSCANVANLFLSQSAGRSRELAVRAALGAGRLRLVRQLLTESLVVSLAGGACGALVAWMLVAALPALAPADFPRLPDVRVDAVFFAIALAGSTLVGLSAGIVPALRGSARAPASPLHGGDRRATDWRAGRLRSLLLVTEAALAVMLLVGAGLLGRSFVSLAGVDPGYEPDRVLIGTVHLTGAAAEAGRGPAAVARILERVRALPGVAAAGAGTMTPLGDSIGISMLTLPGPPGPDGQPPRARALSATVTPGYAEALGLRLRGGRLFRDGDGALETRPFIVNEAFIRTYLDDGPPVVGRRYENRFGLAAIEIVGIVGDALHGGFDAEFEPQIYFPQASDAGFRQTTLVVRTTDDPERIVPALRSIVTDAEAGAALDAVAPLGARVAASMSQPRFAAGVLGAFAALAAGLAATGLYGVLSFHVSRRRREIGIRAALGADRARILRLVLRQGMGVTAVGLALGLAASALGSRALEGMLFGVSRLDGWSFGAAAGVLALVAAAASLVPARRAARVDPAEALRAE